MSKTEGREEHTLQILHHFLNHQKAQKNLELELGL